MKYIQPILILVLMWATFAPRVMTVIEDYSVIGHVTSCGLPKVGVWVWKFDWVRISLYADADCTVLLNDDK